jgi:RNA polymerase sigma-70 factor (ECF subfamily)
MGRRDRGAQDAAPSDLADSFRRGESWALTEVWHRYSAPVSAYLRGRGVTEPDDLTSEVFLQVFKSPGRFRGDEAALRTFVFSVAHARYVDHVRRSVRRGPDLEFDPVAHGGLAESAEADALRVVATRRVEQLLESLSPDQRDVLLLRIVADLSLEQTADVLGKSVGAVKALQHRGLAQLRPHFEPAVSP